jgi:tetratricopeptide (TPR) repeat protein
VVAAAGFGLLAWALVQPAYARRLWWSEPSTAALAERVQRAEGCWVEPVAWQLQALMVTPRWGFADAAEALRLAELAVRLKPSDAMRWSDQGRVASRLVTELGPWPDAVETARQGYARACELEPHLPWDWLRWAALERSVGNMEAAVGLAARAVREEPNYVGGWLFLARVELDRGRTVAARQALTRAERAHRLRFSAFTPYDRGLVYAPRWQFRELETALP